jgi:hypothetical protein
MPSTDLSPMHRTRMPLKSWGISLLSKNNYVRIFSPILSLLGTHMVAKSEEGFVWWRSRCSSRVRREPPRKDGQSVKYKSRKVRQNFQQACPYLVCNVCDVDMCNIYGTLHGGCAAYMIDSYVLLPSVDFLIEVALRCSSSSLVALGVVKGADYGGMSQALNIIWHKRAPV